MSIGIFTGTIKVIERRYTDEEDFLCSVWLMVADLGEQCLRATARNEVAHQMDHLNEGDLITVSGVVDLDSIRQSSIRKTVLAIPTVLQVNGMSQLVLVGRAGSNPTMKSIQNKETGEPGLVAKFNLAVNPPRKSEEPNWYPLEFWGRNAEIVEEFVKQGSLIEVVGSVQMEFWQDRTTGDDRARPVVRVERLQLLGSKRAETGQTGSDGSNSRTEPIASGHSEAAQLTSPSASTSSPTSSGSESVNSASTSSVPEEQPTKRRRQVPGDKSKKSKKQSESQPESELLTQPQ